MEPPGVPPPPLPHLLPPNEQQVPAQQIALTVEMLVEKYDSVDDGVRNGESRVFVRTPKGRTAKYTQASSRKRYSFKAETSTLQTAVVYIADLKPQKTLIFTDPKAVQPRHQLLKDLELLPQKRAGPSVDSSRLWDSRQ